MHSSHTISGIIIFTIAVLLVIDIYSGIDLLASQIEEDSPITKGVVTGSHYWGQDINNNDCYGIDYSYRNPYGEETYYWTSYSTGPLAPGKEVTVTYVKDEPTVSKIKGMTNTAISQMEIAMTPFLLLLGLILISTGFSKHLQPFRIMNNGIVTVAVLAKTKRRNYKSVDEFQANFTTKKNQKVMQVIYCYRLKHAAMPKKDLAIYNKNKPKVFFLIEDLPNYLKKDIQQQVSHIHPELTEETTD